jgi:hypothetical protein
LNFVFRIQDINIIHSHGGDKMTVIQHIRKHIGMASK